MRLYILAICIAVVFCSQAQEQKDTVILEIKNAYVLFNWASPAQQVGDIQNDTYCPGFSAGLLFSPMFGIQPSPVLVGFEVSFLDYNSEPSGTVGTIPVKTQYNNLAGNIVLRFKSSTHQAGLAPFADALIGVMFLNSDTYVSTSGSSSNSSSLFKYDDSGFDCGAAVGVQWCKKNTSQFGITLRLMYLWGKNLKYVIPDSITIDSNGRFNYNTGSINSSYFAIQLGINVSVLKKFYNRG